MLLHLEEGSIRSRAPRCSPRSLDGLLPGKNGPPWPEEGTHEVRSTHDEWVAADGDGHLHSTPEAACSVVRSGIHVIWISTSTERKMSPATLHSDCRNRLLGQLPHPPSQPFRSSWLSIESPTLRRLVRPGDRPSRSETHRDSSPRLDPATSRSSGASLPTRTGVSRTMRIESCRIPALRITWKENLIDLCKDFRSIGERFVDCNRQESAIALFLGGTFLGY